MLRTLLAVAVILSACSSGAEAPAPSPTEAVCTDAFCLDAPVGWGDEVGETYLSFQHSSAPDDTFLTASVVDSEAIVVAAGGSWPATTEEVVESFWALIEQAGEGSLVRTQRMVGGAVRSWGSHSTGDMWFVLVPVEGTVAIGVEIRGPNDSWESHADVVFPSVVPTGR
ncbi:MAG: hypothetical protein ACR2N2_11045 [Acidimicrobiia bacterium]